MVCGIGILVLFVLWNDFGSTDWLRMLTPIKLLNCHEIYQKLYVVEFFDLTIDIRTLLGIIIILSESVLLIFNGLNNSKWRQSI